MIVCSVYLVVCSVCSAGVAVLLGRMQNYKNNISQIRNREMPQKKAFVDEAFLSLSLYSDIQNEE